MKITTPTILVMFSGGLDSLAALHVLRTTQTLPLHVHHVHIHNVENRAPAESRTVNAVREYYGDLDYSESTMQFPSVNGSFLYDSQVYRYMAGYIASLSPIVSIAVGHTKDDAHAPGIAQRIELGDKVLGAFTTVPVIYPVEHLTKQECYMLLPSDLRELAWSCRRPAYTSGTPKPCGHCRTCRELDRITLQLSNHSGQSDDRQT